MNDRVDENRSPQLDEVLKLVRAKVAADQRATLETFVSRYYGQVDPEDLAEREPGDLYGAALSHWSFARKREAGHEADLHRGEERLRNPESDRIAPVRRKGSVQPVQKVPVKDEGDSETNRERTKRNEDA